MRPIHRLREWRESDGTLSGPALSTPWADITTGKVGFERDAVRTSNALITEGRRVLPVDTSSATVTLTLASALVSEGVWVTVKDEGGNSGTNAITIDTEGTETIDGNTSVSISGNYGSVTLYSDGANWFQCGSTSGSGTL